MNSTMELMERKTPLTNIHRRKKGMTLVEMMAALAILVILFGAVSSFIIGTVKIQAKSDKYLDDTTIIKSIMVMFEVKKDGSDKDVEHISPTRFQELKDTEPIEISFNTLEEMQNKLLEVPTDLDGDRYKAEISIDKVESKALYKVTVNIDGYEKYMYINR